MAQVMINRAPSASRWMAVAVTVALCMAAWGAWWLIQSPAAEGDHSGGGALAGNVAPSVVDPGQLAEVRAIESQQAAAASVVAREPEVKPVDRHLSERPDYVSPMEWAMLQGVAQQDADPPKALARLVNSLRFTRQMELWEDMAAMPDKAAKRRRLAVQLLDDLPNRVAHGDLALADAQAKLNPLIADAVGDPSVRAQRQQRELDRLQQAEAAYQASEQVVARTAP